MPAKKNSVSGSWLGNYYYESTAQAFGFEAVFSEQDGSVEGSILDDGHLGEARVTGTFQDPSLSFVKSYYAGGLEAVTYEGSLSDDGKKLAGTWKISTQARGRWLAWRQDEEEMPELDLDAEMAEELVREKVMIRPRTQGQR